MCIVHSPRRLERVEVAAIDVAKRAARGGFNILKGA